ncbi:MAG TPA: NUDIX domain-containing protein [Gaiellaceae bacterium]|nr:NUDIX domain-containing protein [Gaiellaceae bacterium]
MHGPATTDVPDVRAPGLSCVFCGINPGRVSAAAAAHFANPRNDFWRLLHDAEFTPRLLDPQEQFELLPLGYGVTNAAYRTTPGSGDLRRGDFDPERVLRIVREFRPNVIAFVGKEAYRGLFNERPELGPQLRTIEATALYVLPSTSPANAAVPYAERLKWFKALREWIEPVFRPAVRALVADVDDRVLLVQFQNEATGDRWWATPGGGVEAGEDEYVALRRELREEIGLEDFEIGPLVADAERTFAFQKTLYRQRNRIYLVRVQEHHPVPTVDMAAEGVVATRWWTLDEIESTAERLTPPEMYPQLRTLLA